MSNTNVFQLALEIWGGIVCMLIIGLSRWDLVKSSNQTKRLWYFPVVAIFLIFVDVGTYIFYLLDGKFPHFLLQLCTFFVYVLQDYLMIKYAMEINRLIHHSAKLHIDKFFKLIVVLTGGAIVGLVLNIFMPVYYSIDAYGCCVHYVGNIIPCFIQLICILILAFQIRKNEKEFSERMLLAVRVSGVLYLGAFGLQLFYQGFSIINVMIAFNFMLLFLIYWIDEREYNLEQKMDAIVQSEIFNQEMGITEGESR